MKDQDYTAAISVDQSPEQAYAAVLDPRGWWSEEIEGSTDKLNAVFDYHYKDVHRCKMRVVELVPGKRVAWLCLENDFDFIADKTEWQGTRIVFDIARKGGKTELRFTHEGLVPDYECYEVCSDAWSTYIRGSLRNLITSGKGAPNPKE
jgi:hypothetical protein